MRQRTKNSELDAAKAILNGLHNESVSYSHRLDILTMNISSQMKKRLEEYKQKILSSGGNKRAHAGLKQSDTSSAIRSPVYKKQKGCTACDIFNDSEDYDTVVKKIKAMRKAELVTLLESRGLCSIGKKDDLVSRLVDEYLTYRTENNKPVDKSEDPVADEMMTEAISNGNIPSYEVEVEEKPRTMNRKDSMIMTKLVHGTEFKRLSPNKNNLSPNVKQQGILEKKPVSVLKQMFESNVSKNGLKDSEMEVAKENSPTQHENSGTEPRSPIRTFKAAMNSALSVLSIEKHRANSPSPKRPYHEESASRPLSPKMKTVNSPREPQQVVTGSSSKIPVGYLSASKIGSISALSAIKAAKTSYLQSGPARMAVNPDKQKEMREQSKPISSKVLYKTPSQIHTISSSTTTDQDLKRRQKLAEMRAAAAEKALKPGPVLDSYRAQKDLVSRSLANSAVKATATQNASFRSVLASPDASCQYEISDKEDTDSESESDDEDNTSKKIPTWAGSQKLQEKLKKQLQPGGLDPDEIFGEVETCDLLAIFDNPRTRFKKRTSSGNWGKDRATMAEKLAYKRRMQYNTANIA